MCSACLSVHALTLVNKFQKSRNLYMLFMCDVSFIILKMVCVELMVRVQRHAKVSRYFALIKGFIKRILTI